MATYEDINEFSSRPKSSMFDRSLTVRSSSHANPYLYSSVFNRASSINPHSNSRFYNSMISAGNSIKGKVKKLYSVFETTKKSSSGSNNQAPLQSPSKVVESNKPVSSLSKDNAIEKKAANVIRLPGTEDRIVLYFTSLRGVRRTFEDCYAVRMIFKGFRIWVDERDTSMDCAYKKEMQGLFGKKGVSLPQVFIRGELYGGADRIKMMYETGELARVLQGFPRQKPGFFCEFCGDVRFVPCWNCDGSRKIFDENEGLLKRCLECNENGLIRCPDCCY